MAGKTMKELNAEVTTMGFDHATNIFQRMSLITNELKRVAKNLNVGVGKSSYKAVGEADILDAIKPAEEKYCIYSYPYNREIEESSLIESEKIDYNTKQPVKSKQLYMRIKTIYRFVNTDKPEEYIDITTYGDGVDTQDKAPGKAMTYADKYALMKAYKISTGDDPDQSPSEELKNKENVSKEKPKEQQKPQQDESGTLLTEWNRLRTQMSGLGIDFRSEAIKQWIADYTGYANQDADIMDLEKMKKINSVYRSLIKGKKKEG